MRYLLGYDISDPKRLQKVYRRMCNYAVPIQYSIFLFDGSKKQLQICIDDVLCLINKKEDDFRAYQLPQKNIEWLLGKAFMPEGIYWTGLPAGLE